MNTEDTQILELALAAVTDALNDLVGACMDYDMNPKAPERKALMQARARLPQRCLYALPPKAKK